MLKTSLDHINMSVKNLKESSDWYQNTFDFVKVEEGKTTDGPWAILRSENSMLCLYEEKKMNPDFNDNQLRVYHFGLKISDKNLWQEKIKKQKLEILYGGEVKYPHSTSWYVTDPNGYEIEVSHWDGDEIQF